MAKTKEISRRIKSVSNTKKITKAMEMVSASKMRKAVEAVLKTRTYANLSWEMVLRLAKIVEGNNEVGHPLLTRKKEMKKAALILISSNRGLCGGFNTAVINRAKESLKKHNLETDIILVGKKGSVMAQQKYNIAAEFPKSDLVLSESETNPIARMVITDYLSGKYDKVTLVYTDFINGAKQIPRVKQLLPINIKFQDQHLGITEKEEKEKKHLLPGEFIYEYTFEPSPIEVLDLVVPRLIEIQLYQALLESNASEHSARMAAMHQATESASDMVNELTLFYNKARQSNITAEIAEISAGANAQQN
ncbi:MAG: ATP synthase F1 subunit gamma [Patescibacteria group bacterium]|nr:ATP synthase F1 subunit gamma [Patescibacteria group bacterium]